MRPNRRSRRWKESIASGQRIGVEVGPVHVGEVELGVRQSPEQEVADPLLAAGPDE
jgi:hypothetical protein